MLLGREKLCLEDDTLKNHRFFELILLDNKSTWIEHIKDHKGKVHYSKSRMLKTYSAKNGAKPHSNNKSGLTFQFS